ncbi:NAD(P)H-dependent flavin oxidoreductase [Aquabacterium sp. OR-4]|uniref:NAD(P)H-dependent flavin oxidoreductase n=1 Tax=Aquabacterium sp. OR-4 TaxID=2978127 RepID=UPI0021B2F226|nr:nitronate monooxygenase family protein [Aquabacterium sp. OR-4]MDT7834349.1 nitronate monooxygenase family protein [Aquabacterium sp. OR-4]
MLSPITANTGIAPDLLPTLHSSGLQPLRLAGRLLLPIVQGGMGVGVSAHKLAGAVARQGGIGTLSSVDLRRHHPDLMARTEGLSARPGQDADTKAQIDAANLEAVSREVKAAREAAGGLGLIAMNVMRAVSDYAAYVKRSLEAGVDMVVVGAGLPLDLPDLAAEHPDALLVPILSDSRGVALLVKKWERKKRLPDAIVIEHPRLAGGHLGAARIADLNDPRFDFERVIPESREFLARMGVDIPLIAAGGIRSCEDIARIQALGGAAVQLGTPFAVTTEGDASLEFKRVLAEARDEDMVEFTSVAGLPARAVATPWLKNYLKAEPALQAVAHAKARCTKAFDCLAQCGLRDGFKDWGQFCIDNQLAAAMRGDLKKGLFFRGVGALPFGAQIRSVRELMERLLTRGVAVPTALPGQA